MKPVASSQNPADANECGLIDRQYIFDFFDGNTDLVEKMATVFVVTYSSSPQEPSCFLGAGGTYEAKNWFHKLKSSSRYVGAISLSELCEKCEETINAGQAVPDKVIRDVEQMLLEVIESLK